MVTRSVVNALFVSGLASLCFSCSQPPPADGGEAGTEDAAIVDVGQDVPFVEPVLAPPPAGRGIQMRVTFDVPPGTEQQRCWRFRLPSATDMEVVRYEVAYNSGSHHMNLFRVLPSVEPSVTLEPETGIEGSGVPCFNAVNFAAYDLVVGSQSQTLNWQLPPGIAYRLHGHTSMLLQSHFVNGATQSTVGNRAVVLVNLWTAENPATITNHLGSMFANNRSINLPPRQMSEFTTRCVLPAGGTFVALTGHFHSRGQQFAVNSSMDGVMPGAEIYRSTTWAEPPFRTLDTPVTVPANGGLFYTCDFFNPTDFPITFGPHVEFEEHCNLFAYYYPSDPDARARYCF